MNKDLNKKQKKSSLEGGDNLSKAKTNSYLLGTAVRVIGNELLVKITPGFPVKLETLGMQAHISDKRVGNVFDIIGSVDSPFAVIKYGTRKFDADVVNSEIRVSAGGRKKKRRKPGRRY